MTTNYQSASGQTDLDLVQESLSGNRDAFGHIVARYQNLICSLAYSATGNFGQSEDLAQETFVTAWKHLRELREPEKLRSWICGIARNTINNWLRRQGREPNHKAGSLEEVSEAVSTEPWPVDRAISNEESELLWRSLERIPEVYREPLVLFYREQQSVASVALDLGLSEDAVKQRLSRGRKLLQEQVLALVEGALQRSTPGMAFTLSVVAALPAFTLSAKAATLAAAAKGGAAAKAAAASGVLGAILGPVLVVFGNYAAFKLQLKQANSDAERVLIKKFYKSLLWPGLAFPLLAVVALFAVYRGLGGFTPWFAVAVIATIVGYVVFLISFSLKTLRTWNNDPALKLARAAAVASPQKFYEYRSKAQFLGLPLVHLRFGNQFAGWKNPVRGWIAGGDLAVGGLVAFGAAAVAPISFGGLAIGLIPVGGFAVGVLVLGGLGFGGWTYGGLAIGWQAVGGCALAWNAAMGGCALARDFASGGLAIADQANNDVARQFIASGWFFRIAQVIARYAIWLNLIWSIPVGWQWRRFRSR